MQNSVSTVIKIELDNSPRLLNVIVTYIPQLCMNGTSRDEYLISIPEWKWSTMLPKSLSSPYSWEDLFRESSVVEFNDEQLILARELARVNFQNMF
jgi:hypothetical protein